MRIFLAAIAMFVANACAGDRASRKQEIEVDPTIPVASAPAPKTEQPRPAAPSKAQEPETELDKCIAKCVAEEKAKPDGQASEFWCQQQCSGDKE